MIVVHLTHSWDWGQKAVYTAGFKLVFIRHILLTQQEILPSAHRTTETRTSKPWDTFSFVKTVTVNPIYYTLEMNNHLSKFKIFHAFAHDLNNLVVYHLYSVFL